MLVDISDIRKDLNEEEKEIFDKVIKASASQLAS